MIRDGIRALQEMTRLTKGMPNLRILLVSGLVGTLGGGLLQPVFPLFLEQQGLSLARIGVVFTIGSLLPVVLQPILGALSDRFSRKGMVVGISLLTSSLLPLFTVFHEVFWLAVVLALKLTLERSAAPVSSAMIGDFAPPEQRPMVFATLDASINLMFVLALFLSPVVVAALPMAGVFYLAAALFMGSSLMLLALKEAPRAPVTSPATRPTSGSRIRVALAATATGLYAPMKVARQSPALSGIMLYQFLFGFALDLFPLYLPLYVVKLGAPEEAVGPIIASSWLAYALVQPLGGRLAGKLEHRQRLIVGGLLGMAVCAILLGAAQLLPAPLALPAAIAMWVLIAIPDGLFRPAAQSLVLELAPAEQRGEVVGAMGSAAAIANVVAPLAYGAVAQPLGLGASFGLAGAALAVAGLRMHHVLTRRVRDLAPAVFPQM